MTPQNPNDPDYQKRAMDELYRAFGQAHRQPKPKEPHEIELLSAKILIVALLRRLRGKAVLAPDELMIQPNEYAIHQTFDNENRKVVFTLIKTPSQKVIEETE